MLCAFFGLSSEELILRLVEIDRDVCERGELDPLGFMNSELLKHRRRATE